MKNHKAMFFSLIITGISLAAGGCSLFRHHEPKSSFKIIPEGDKNPSIKYTPDTVSDTPLRRVQVERGPVQPQ